MIKTFFIIFFFICHNRQIYCDLCSDPYIDSAVRVSASKFMFVFKGQDFWVLNIERSTLSKSYPIAKHFNGYGDIKPLIGSWVDTGFDEQSPNKGKIYLLKSNTIYRYNVVIGNENNFNTSLEKSYAFGQFWSGFEAMKQIEAITDLNSVRDKEDYKTVEPRDVLALNSDKFALLWPEPGGQTYVTKKTVICARSEQNELSIFDLNKRSSEYWTQDPTQDCDKWKGVKMSSIIDIKAMAYFPIKAEVYVFGQQDYCKIKIKFAEKNLKCNKQSIKKLFGCDSEKMSTKTIQGEVEDDAAKADTPGQVSPNDFWTEAQPSTSPGSNDLSTTDNTFLYVMIVIGVIILIVVILLILFVALKKNPNKSKDQKYSPVVVTPIDPRYGQLDSNVNLSMKIASPSYQALDQKVINEQMEEEHMARQQAQTQQQSQQMQKQAKIKAEDMTERSDSDSPRNPKSRKALSKKLHSPRSPISD